MKTIRKLHPARRADVADLITYQALPISPSGIDEVEPFIFLNHHGPQVYPPHNEGLPFGPHPHRGFETVTFILEGDLRHKDSGGYESIIRAGGVQWMTAGSGLIHMEVSSEEFKARGGSLEILQLWLNLPARLKMTEPRYVGLQKEQIPAVKLDGGKVTVNLISGDWDGVDASLKPLTDVHLASIFFDAGGQLRRDVAAGRSVFFYVVRGDVNVNGRTAAARHIVVFDSGGETIEVRALTDALILFGHARPNKEPIAARGPFVMNTDAEIDRAIRDYQSGKFGVRE